MLAITVSELNGHIKNLLDCDQALHKVLVRGELSNYKVYGSGHHYFSLKDADSTIRCTMWKGQAAKLAFVPKDGMQVFLTGKVTVYPRDGSYQIQTTEIIPDGVGDLALAFEQLKDKLHAEGLFDNQHKKRLPQFPRKIALITSPSGAVVHDMTKIMARRYPLAKILVCPVRVQGEGAPEEIVAMIETVNNLRAVDVMIVGRGGGSLEDLWAFNNERVARAIFSSVIPIVSAVGHEPDVTIADFVADVRASTPSHACEIITPDKNELRAYLTAQSPRLGQALTRRLSHEREKLHYLSSHYTLRDSTYLFGVKHLHLDAMMKQMQVACERNTAKERTAIAAIGARLDALSPLRVLERGYAIAQANDGRPLRSIKNTAINDTITIRLTDGEIITEVRHVGKKATNI